MSKNVAVIMDPIAGINPKKDSTFAMMLAAQERGWTLAYLNVRDLWLRDGRPFGRYRTITVYDRPQQWYQFTSEAETVPLNHFDIVLMRKDPPFDMEYIYTTYILEQAEAMGVLVVNKPRSLRDANEKLYTAWFPQCCAPTLVTRERSRIKAFLAEHQEIILKPLDGMGGASVFRIRTGDPNTNVIIETLTRHEQRFVMAQRFIPEIAAGDKRILLIDGEAVPYALARIPARDDTRGNLAAGGRGEGRPLSERDRWICDEIGPTLAAKGLLFVGIDVIGDYLTEINVTSPTCIRELDAWYGLNIAATLCDAIERRLHTR